MTKDERIQDLEATILELNAQVEIQRATIVALNTKIENSDVSNLMSINTFAKNKGVSLEAVNSAIKRSAIDAINIESRVYIVRNAKAINYTPAATGVKRDKTRNTFVQQSYSGD